MSIMIPEIDDIVNFYTPEIVEQTARETGFVEGESKLKVRVISSMTELFSVFFL